MPSVLGHEGDESDNCRVDGERVEASPAVYLQQVGRIGVNDPGGGRRPDTVGAPSLTPTAMTSFAAEPCTTTVSG